jgi:purine-binding chemotaxis protein CheW
METLPAPAASPPAALAGPARPFCTFRLGGDLMAVGAALVQSVHRPPPLTPLPHAPPAVRGYANLRGQTLLVLDLGRLLGRAPAADGPDARLVVFQPALGDPFGVLVDRIGDVAVLRPDQIEDRPPGGDDLVVAVGKLDRELVALLDARRFLPRVERAPAT